MDLSRFHAAQSGGTHERALAELRAGRKTSHWIWYVLPQLQGLGQSAMARRYALSGRAEAVAYLADPVLASRLAEIVEAIRSRLAAGIPLVDLMSSEIDALKCVSSLTLFERVAEEEGKTALAEACREVLDAAQAQGIPRCPITLAER